MDKPHVHLVAVIRTSTIVCNSYHQMFIFHHLVSNGIKIILYRPMLTPHYVPHMIYLIRLLFVRFHLHVWYLCFLPTNKWLHPHIFLFCWLFWVISGFSYDCWYFYININEIQVHFTVLKFAWTSNDKLWLLEFLKLHAQSS